MIKLNIDSINGYVECIRCEMAFALENGLPNKCPGCGLKLWSKK